MRLHALGERIKEGYTTWGCMWPKESVAPENGFILRNLSGNEIPVQSRVTAYWPDGSVKWTAHTADSSLLEDEIEVEARPVQNAFISKELKVSRQDGLLVIQAGMARAVIDEKSKSMLESFEFNGKIALSEAVPVLILEEPSDSGTKRQNYEGFFDQAELEESGPLCAIVKFTGIHVNGSSRRFPFVIRMAIGLDSPRVSFTHTFLYDGDEDRDFLKGIGIRFQSPLFGELYNRHIRLQGDFGAFHESPALLLSWRPRIPEGIYENQMNGVVLRLSGKEKELVDKVMQDMPFWDQYSLTQDSSEHFSIKKKIRDSNCCLIDCLHGHRSCGGVAIGSEHGSVLFATRDFWEKNPSGYTVSGLTTDEASVSAWFWSPEAEPMDFRHYANRGYNQVYYEGYDYKGADPYGIACTSQMVVKACDELIPSNEDVSGFAESVRCPVQYVGSPEFYHEMGAFGHWSLPDRSSETEIWLEDQLSKALAFYIEEVDQRGWYGLFNYGDFMHTYDRARHQWRYDMGGYAWDNTELVPTLWIWHEFLRSGRQEAFILAEKLSRHASEVDVYHMGKYKGLGSRHNVRHWGCPCKEARIAMAGHHRVYYYLTGDRRFEDIFDELKDNEKTFASHDPLGDFYNKEEMTYPAHARSGPDWSSLCSNWMTEWERKNDTSYRNKIETGIIDLKNAPLKLVSGPDFEFDPETVHLRYIGERASGGTHLQICMGSPQIWMEIADLLDDEEWKRMLADYGRFYYLPNSEQLQESGGIIGEREFSLPFMAAAMGAYGASFLNDSVLAKRTWRHLLHALMSSGNHEGFQTVTVENCANKRELKEIPWISTNFAAQWCLNVIVCLEFIREALPKTLKEADLLVAEMDGGSFRKA
jgi:hypothetical protein